MVVIDSENILHGPELLESIPNHSFGKTLYTHLASHCNLPIGLIDAVTRESISYKTVFEKSLRLAHSLKKFGVKQDDVIGISSGNGIYCSIPIIAGLLAGATVTMFNPQFTLREFAHVANISKPCIIFSSTESLQKILQSQRELKYIRRVLVIDPAGSEIDVEWMDEFISSNSEDYEKFEPIDVDSQHVAFILYSSGTTGLPKGVMFTHYNWNTYFVLLKDPRLFKPTAPGERHSLHVLPHYHISGITLFLVGLLVGDKIVVMPKFKGRTFLKAIHDFKIKSLWTTPNIPHFLATNKLVGDYDLSHIEDIKCGAAPLGKHTEEIICNRLKRVSHIQRCYGLTETGLVAVMPLVLSKPFSVGKVVPGTSAKVIDINSNQPMGPGKQGELCFRGPHIMKGYKGDSISTDIGIDGDGWFKTGDLGYYDEEGNIFIVGRLKELIKYEGYQVQPTELEAILLEHPKIVDAAVIGIPDESTGEVPLAFVVKVSDQNLTENEVKNFVAEQVSPYKWLRGGVRFVEDIPKSSTGKILRSQLQQLLTHKSRL